MTALLLLGPWTPLLFQGQEFGTSTPFRIFHRYRRRTDARSHPQRPIRVSLAVSVAGHAMKCKNDCRYHPTPRVFIAAKLDFSERQKKQELYDLHVDLMKLRREDSRFREQVSGGVDGAVLGPKSFLLRYFSKGNNDDRLLVVNLGQQQALSPSPEPLLAPLLGFEWTILWSSDSVKYGGPGEVTLPAQDPWTLPAESTIALRLARESAPRRQPKKR